MVCEAFVTPALSDGVSCPWRLPPTMAVVAEVSSVLAGGQEVEEQLSAQGAGHWALGQRNTGCVLSAHQPN